MTDLLPESGDRSRDPHPPGSTATIQTAAAGTSGDAVRADAPDPLAGLFHMSNTAGAGTQEYVAINPMAIAALLLGFASILVILSELLLVIPLIGVICAIVAIVQIRRSNQTQTGAALAVAGLVLAGLLGGGRFAYVTMNRYREGADEQQVSQLIDALGKDVAAERYEQAYQRFAPDFRERVNFTTFENALKAFANRDRAGALADVVWNREKMDFRQRPDSDTTEGVAMVLVHFQKNPDRPARLILTFEKSAGEWHIADIPALFPPKKPDQSQ
jgi:hypothetical protein